MIRAVDHLGIAVSSLEQSLPFWADALGLDVAAIETVDSEGVKVAMLPAGRSRIELLEPLGDDSPVAKFIAGRGQGIHHVTFEVADVEAALRRLKARGVRVIGDAPRDGAEGSRVAFLHPKSTGGVLVELVEKSPAAAEGSEIVPGQPVLVYLREPSEKLWGILRRLDGAGVMLEGIDLTSFDDWVAQIESGEDSVVGPSVLFIPMTRVDKVLLDRPSGQLPSLAERFHRRTGKSVREILGPSGG
jgi:methylmalonyl-CoA/ethylmalonyl-CoA epimerase